MFTSSKYKKEFFEIFYQLFYEKIIIPKDLYFLQEKAYIIQTFLLEKLSKKEDINNIIDISSNLEYALLFINTNYIKIIDKLYFLSSYLSYFRNENIIVNLNNVEINNEMNIDNIIKFLDEIIQLGEEKSYHLINYEELFSSLVNKYYSKDINSFSDLCNYFKLHCLIPIIQKHTQTLKTDIFYDKIHSKGMNLVKNKKMNTVQIISFIISQDIYYYNPEFRINGKNDPSIMEYISITDDDPNYMENIELIKKSDLINFFLDSIVENEFYEVILKKIKKIKDFQIIFYIFPFKNINEKFTVMINAKMEEIKYTYLDMNSEEYNEIFNILDNWIKINTNVNFNAINILFKVFDIIDILKKYLIYLLKQNNMNIMDNDTIILLAKKLLTMNSEILRQEEYHNFLIDIILNSDDKLCIYFLKYIQDLSPLENDFYQKGKNSKIMLLKAFSDKCKIILTKYSSMFETYPYEINKFREKMFNKLKKGLINFNLLKSLIIEDKEFQNKIKLITSNEQEAEQLYNKLKNNYTQFQRDYNNIEKIIEYYSTFYSNSKEELISIIKKKQKEYKEQKMISELINMDLKHFFDIKNFYLKEAIEESANIKYKNSSFFMELYRKHYEKDKLEKSEDKILKESITDYINIFKEIIEEMDSTKPLLILEILYL